MLKRTFNGICYLSKKKTELAGIYIYNYFTDQSDPDYHLATKVLAKTNLTSPNSVGLCHFITEFL